MKSGDILLFKGGGLTAKIIQWGTSSPYSHVAICANADMNLAIEAMTKGIRARDIRKIKQDYDIFRVKEVYEYDLNKVISFLVSKLNERYDFAGVFFLGILKLFRLKKMANKWQKDRDYFCSELGDKAFLYGGIDLTPENEADITSPADISLSPVVYKVIREIT